MENSEYLPKKEELKTDDEYFTIAIRGVREFNLDREDLIKELKHHGASDEKADYIASRVAPSAVALKGEGREGSSKDIIVGSLWFFGGIIVTAVTYSNASEGGGRYVIAWGAIIFGGYQLISGLIRATR